MDIGTVIRRERERRGWTRAQLAEEAGTGRITIRDIETGRGYPNLKTLEKLARGLDFEPGELLLKTTSEEAQEENERYTMTINEAAAALGRPRTTINLLISKGQLPTKKYGWRRYVDAQAVQRLRQRRTT